MKAVYEMPRVQFEEFTCDSSVAASCALNTQVEFDCLYGGQYDTASVLSAQLNILNVGGGTCDNEAGFADYADVTATEEDDITSIPVTIGGANGGHSENNSHMNWDYFNNENNYTATIKDSSVGSFLGWLYIFGQTSRSGNSTTWTYSQTGWSLNSNTKLTYTGTHGMNTHPMLAPVFRTNIVTSL